MVAGIAIVYMCVTQGRNPFWRRNRATDPRNLAASTADTAMFGTSTTAPLQPLNAHAVTVNVAPDSFGQVLHELVEKGKKGESLHVKFTEHFGAASNALHCKGTRSYL